MEQEITLPYRNIIQHTRVQILPHMMNSDIESNMDIVLQKKVEGKCNRYGYIDKVHRIDTYDEEIMTSENLSGAANYNITYHCRICIPVENTIIIGTVKALNSELVIVSNGPLIIFIPKTNIDSNLLEISNELVDKTTKSPLKQNDFVKVLIDKIKINQGDTQIKCIGKLLNRAVDDEIKHFFGSSPTVSNFII